jgi:hypothetical protein
VSLLFTYAQLNHFEVERDLSDQEFHDVRGETLGTLPLHPRVQSTCPHISTLGIKDYR